MKTFSELTGMTSWYPDLERKDFKQLLGRDFLLLDARIIPNFETDFGSHDLAQLKMAEKEDPKKAFTVVSSGKVVVRGVAKYIELGKPPVTATPTYTEKEDGNGYFELK